MKTQALTLLAFALLIMATPFFKATAAIHFQGSFSYHSHTDDQEDLKYSKINALVFMGAPINSNETVILGQDVHIVSLPFTLGTGKEGKLGLTEIGPRLIYFLSKSHSSYVSFAWHPYAKGTRTTTTDATQEVTGSSMLGTFGFVLPVSKSMAIGANMTYYQYSVSKYSESAVSSTTASSYTSIIPMLDFSFFFN